MKATSTLGPSVARLADLPSFRMLDKVYRPEVHAEIAKPVPPRTVITGSDIAGLANPVQWYFRAGGFLGRPRMANARLRWNDFTYAEGTVEGVDFDVTE